MATTHGNEEHRWSMHRRKFLSAAALGGVGLAGGALVGCGDDDDDATGGPPGTSTSTSASGSPSGPKRGGIVYGQGYQGQTLSPNSSALRPPELAAIFDSLTRLTNDGVLEPSLAESWELDPNDNKKWVFHLRDTEWSDGKPFTAEDVKFTFDYIRDPNNKSAWISRAGTIEDVEVLDARTVVVKCTGDGDPIFPKRAFELFIQPKHYVGDPNFGDAAQATKPIGTGAFVLDSYSAGSLIRLKANPSSWRGTLGVDAVEIRVLLDNQTRLAAFEAREVDMIDIVPLPDLERVRGMSGAEIKREPTVGYNGWDLGYFDPPTADPRVRLAINHAVDMQTIADTVFFGLPKVMTQAVTEDTFGYNPAIKGYAYDPELARQLLREAGFADGFTVQMAFRGDSGVQSRPFALATASYLEEVGIRTELIPLEVNVWRSRIYGQEKAEPIMQNTWVSGPARDASVALQWFLSDNPRKAYNRPDFDEAYKAAVGTFDEAERLAQFHKCLEIFYEDPPNNWGVENVSANGFWTNKIKEYDNSEFLDTIVLA